MSYKPGDSYVKRFATSNLSTQASQNADSLPTATAALAGTGTGSMSLTVTNISTGLYEITGTIPGTRVKGDVLNVSVVVTMSGTTGGEVIDTQILDSKRVGDLNDSSYNGGPVASVTGGVGGSVAGSVASVTNPVSVNLSQTGLSPRNLGSIADASLTVGDALVCAIASAAGKQSVSGTTYTVETPSTGTVVRSFTLDSGTSPTLRS